MNSLLFQIWIVPLIFKIFKSIEHSFKSLISGEVSGKPIQWPLKRSLRLLSSVQRIISCIKHTQERQRNFTPCRCVNLLLPSSVHVSLSFPRCANNDLYSVLEFCTYVLREQIPKDAQNHHNNPLAWHPSLAVLNFLGTILIRSEHICIGFPLPFS
jgi:hypothetical protein